MEIQGIVHKDLILLMGSIVTSVQDLRIEERLNNHGELQVLALIDADDKQEIFYEDVEEFAIFYQKGEKIQSLFQGIIMESDIQSYGDIYLLQIKAKTATCFMDVTRKKRIFQDPTVTSHELVKLIMSIYRGSKYLTFIPDIPIGEPIVQYEETDWEFLNRFFSRYNVPILVDCNGLEQRFAAGISKESVSVDWTDNSYEILYEIDLLHSYEENTNIPVSLKHGISYLVTSYEVHSLGSSVKINNQEMYISNIERTIQDGILTNKYTLCYKEGFAVPKYYNHKITGVSIDGYVRGVKRNRIQVMTTVEGLVSQNSYWFPFSTVAASNDGSGWYCMPEVGDPVRIYFPVNDEKEGYTITNIQGDSSNSLSETAMSNPNMKNISANNKNVFFTGDSIVFDVDDENCQMVISGNGEITLNTKQSITIEAIESIIFYAQNQLTFSADGEINIANEKGGHISIAEGQLDITANKILMNPLIEEEAEEIIEE